MENDQKFEGHIRDDIRQTVDLWVTANVEFGIIEAIRMAKSDGGALGLARTVVIASTRDAIRDAIDTATLAKNHRRDVHNTIENHTNGTIRTFLRLAIMEAGVQNKAHNISASISDITYDAFVERAELVLDNLITQKTWAETHDVMSLIESSDVDARLSCRYRIQDTLGAAVTARGMDQTITDAINEIVLLPRWNDDEVVERIEPPIQERTKNIARWQLPLDLHEATTNEVRSGVNAIAPLNFSLAELGSTTKRAVEETIESFFNSDDAVERAEIVIINPSVYEAVRNISRNELPSDLNRATSVQIRAAVNDCIRNHHDRGRLGSLIQGVLNETIRNFSKEEVERIEIVNQPSIDVHDISWYSARYDCCAEICKTCDDIITYEIYDELRKDFGVGLEDRSRIVSVIANEVSLATLAYQNQDVERIELDTHASSATWRATRHVVHADTGNQADYLTRHMIKEEVNANFSTLTNSSLSNTIQWAINEATNKALGYGK